ncbi:MAG: hypothetical protein GKR90_23845 [Pseudomonadales bacterium]|nr:hypothetical protein [Pseudomonadales bacterium]
MSADNPDKPNDQDPEPLYKALPDEKPPASVDAAVLAHARVTSASANIEVNEQADLTGAATRAQPNWNSLGRRFATAAVVVLAVGIYLQTDQDLTTAQLDTTTQTISTQSHEPKLREAEGALQQFSDTHAELQDTVSVAEETTQNSISDLSAGAAVKAPQAERLPVTKDRPETKFVAKRRAQEPAAPQPMIADVASSGRAFANQRAKPKEELIEEIIVTAATVAPPKSVLLSEGGYRLLALEDQGFSLEHQECSIPYDIAKEASDFTVEREAFVYKESDKDVIARCLTGSWTIQSQDDKN